MIPSETLLCARSLMREGARRLAEAGLVGARAEAEWLLGQLLKRPRLELYLDREGVPPPTAARFLEAVQARCQGHPLQHLLGEADFWGERFEVGPGVFIPRPETEVIAQAAVAAMSARQARRGGVRRLLDLGTGTGCLAVTLAKRLAPCVVVAVELSWEALCTARRNALRHRVMGQVHLVQGRWAEALRGEADGIVANPPYVPSGEVDRLPLEVRREPRLSLDGGPDGLREARAIVEAAGRVLAPGGCLAVECGDGQADALADAVRACGWADRVEIVADLTGRPRGVLVTRQLSHHGLMDR